MADSIDWKKIQKGDKSVFNKMFDYYYLPLCAFIFPYLKEKELAEDIVVDCFVKIWEEHRNLEIKSSLQNYLVTLVKNSAISYLRKKHPEFSDLQNLPESIPNEEQEPLRDAGLLNELYEAINKLPEQRRNILKMAAFEGKSYPQIAEELGISINTVKTQMGRSYKFLREELDVTQRTINFLLFL